MIEINSEDIKEVKFCWDWKYAVIPKEYINKFIYNEVESNKYSNDTLCNYVNLEIDLEYIKTHKLYESFSNDLDLEESIFDVLQEKNTWYLKIIYNNEKSIEINLPSYRKDFYCSEENYLSAWDAKNSCEHHKIQNNNYIIEWIEPEKRDIYMNQKEINIFFKKGNLSEISTFTHSLGIEIVDRILKLNVKENSITDRIEQLSKKDGGRVIVFDKFKENVLKIIHRLHNVCRAR